MTSLIDRFRLSKRPGDRELHKHEATAVVVEHKYTSPSKKMKRENEKGGQVHVRDSESSNEHLSPAEKGYTGEKRISSFEYIMHESIPPHTLLLGTFPSVTSLDCREYYGKESNCFWWIVGDALGFCRGGPIREPKTVPSGKKEKVVSGIWPEQWPNKVQKPILDGIRCKPPTHKVLCYEDQVDTLLKAGLVLWNMHDPNPNPEQTPY